MEMSRAAGYYAPRTQYFEVGSWHCLSCLQLLQWLCQINVCLTYRRHSFAPDCFRISSSLCQQQHAQQPQAHHLHPSGSAAEIYMAASSDVAVSMKQSCTYTKRELTVPCLQMFLFQDGAVPQGDEGDTYKGIYLCEEKITQVGSHIQQACQLEPCLGCDCRRHISWWWMQPLA